MSHLWRDKDGFEIANGKRLWANHKKKTHYVTIQEDGGLLHADGVIYNAPSGAAAAVRGYDENGTTFWRMPDGTPLKDYRMPAPDAGDIKAALRDLDDME